MINEKENPMKIKSVISFMVLSFCSLVVDAETWYIDESAGSRTPFSTPSVWTNAAGVRAQGDFSKPDDKLVVLNGVQLTYSGNVTVSPPLHIGDAVEGALAVLYHISGKLNAQIHWHNGRIQSQLAKRNSPSGMAGTITVDGTEKGGVHIWSYNKVQDDADTYSIAWGIEGELIGDDRQIVNFIYAPGKIKSEPAPVQQLRVLGNNEKWFGQFAVSNYANLVVCHGNAAGPDNVLRSDAIVLGDHARFAVAAGIVPNSARGITITGTDVRFLAKEYPSGSKDCTDYVLNMPISGTGGFTKAGAGRVALGGMYSAGDITVEEGTLEILGSAEIPQATKITVKSGAALITHHSGRNPAICNLEIVQEDGASVEKVIDTTEIDFDADTATAMPVDLPDDFLAIADVVQFSLTQSMPLPLHEPATVKIMTYKGEKTLTPEMFADSTVKTFGLPKTFVTICAEDGVQSVYLNMRPAVVSVADIPSQKGVNINGTAETWSDKKMPHEGADYVLTNRYVSYENSANTSFLGDSLVLSANEYTSKASDNKLLLSNGGAVNILPPVEFVLAHSDGRDHGLSGKICLNGNYGDEQSFTFKTKYNDPGRVDSGNLGSACLSAELSGGGTLVMGTEQEKGLSGLTGNNSAYKGRIAMRGHSDATLSSGLRVRVDSADNFGGRLDEFRFDALTLSRNAFLYPLNDVSVPDNANRGWYVNNAGVECGEGITFSCDRPLRINGKFSKIGAGTLRIGGPVSYGSDGSGASGVMEVREGRLAILSDASAAGLSVVFSNNTAFAVGCGLATGLTAVPSVLTDDGSAGKVALAFDEDSIPEDAGDSISAVVATLPAGSADISAMFNISGRVSRYVVFSLEKRSVEIDSVSYDVYELKGARKGLTICIR